MGWGGWEPALKMTDPGSGDSSGVPLDSHRASLPLTAVGHRLESRVDTTCSLGTGANEAAPSRLCMMAG